MGTPHVHRRNGSSRQHILRLRHNGHLRPNRHQDLQLVGDVVGRQDSLHRADDVRRAVAAHALVRGDVSDEQWQRWAPLVGMETIFELTTLVGYYSTLALQLRAFRVDEQDQDEQDETDR